MADRPGAGRLRRVAIVPSAPLVLDLVSPAQAEEHRGAVAALRGDRATVLADLDAAHATIVVAAGLPSGVHAHATADLAGLGLPQVVVERAVASGLLDPLTRSLQRPLLVGEPIGVDATVLLASTPAGAPVVAVEVPATAEATGLLSLGLSLVAAVERTASDVQIVVAGDLCAGLHRGSPRYEVPGAAATQAAAIAAIRAGRPEDLASIGADRAAATVVRSWAPLVVATAAAQAAGLAVTTLSEHEVRGVGHVVGALS